jgi:hypothetical protein
MTLRSLRRRAARLGRTRPQPPQLDDDALRSITDSAGSRLDLWSRFVAAAHVRRMAEIGVYRGDFAAHILKEHDELSAYYMIDPWTQLSDWDKPANKPSPTLQRYHDETMRRTADWKGKRTVLRGRTVDVIDRIPDGSLDFVYIDGDHTLRGITIDLVKSYAKVRPRGWIGGDDFSASIWQHGQDYEPTLVFPFAVHFAEAVGARIFALPRRQFLLLRPPRPAFAFVDFTGRYGDVGLKSQFLRS